MASCTLTDFVETPPRHIVAQDRALGWLAEAHAQAEGAARGLSDDEVAAFAARLRRVIERCAPGPDRIATRGCSIDEIVEPAWTSGELYAFRRQPHGAGMAARMRRFAAIADAYFVETYAGQRAPPDDLVHVTCTGYESPSAAQRLVAARAWPTRVVHAYHMGCYAALPAVRLAEGLLLGNPDRDARVDIAHTEVCSLHLDASVHEIEQLVVQSLFADGFIRYSMRRDGGRGLRVVAAHEVIAPESAGAMTWIPGEAGMRMTLARDVPERIAGILPGFAAELFRRGGRSRRDAATCVVAVHPGGPKIIDRVRDVLELAEAQVGASRGVLRERGNMSSATLPHIWKGVLADPAVAAGTLIASFAFGPGLTICGALFEKT